MIKNNVIVTNGDQTDTVYDFIKDGKSFEDALKTRCFEPDAPNFTPRISALITFEGGSFSYKISILKSADPEGSACCRYTFSYPPVPASAISYTLTTATAVRYLPSRANPKGSRYRTI